MMNPIMPHDSCDHCDPIMHHDESYHAIIVECSLVMIPVLHANRPSDAILPVLLAPKDQMIRMIMIVMMMMMVFDDDALHATADTQTI